MSAASRRGPIVIDTDVFSAELVPGSPLAELYAPIITGRPAFISFQTVTALQYGALRRGWGAPRMVKLEAKIQRAGVVHTGPDLVLVHARLRAACEAVGTRSPSESTTRTGGSQLLPFASTFRWSRTTGSSATSPDSCSSPRHAKADSVTQPAIGDPCAVRVARRIQRPRTSFPSLGG